MSQLNEAHTSTSTVATAASRQQQRQLINPSVLSLLKYVSKAFFVVILAAIVVDADSTNKHLPLLHRSSYTHPPNPPRSPKPRFTPSHSTDHRRPYHHAPATNTLRTTCNVNVHSCPLIPFVPMRSAPSSDLDSRGKYGNVGKGAGSGSRWPIWRWWVRLR